MECKTLHSYLQLLTTSGRCAVRRSEQAEGFGALIHVFQVESVADSHENAEKYSCHGGDHPHPSADHQQWREKCHADSAQVEIIAPFLQVPHQVGRIKRQRFENEHDDRARLDILRGRLFDHRFEHPVHGFGFFGLLLAVEVFTDGLKRFAGFIGGNAGVPKSLGLGPKAGNGAHESQETQNGKERGAVHSSTLSVSKGSAGFLLMHVKFVVFGENTKGI